MRLGRDGIAGLIGLATSLFLLPFSFGLPKLPIVPIGPGFYPALVLGFMALTSLVLVLQDVVAQRRAAPVEAQEPTAAQPKRNYGLVLASFVTVALYIAAAAAAGLSHCHGLVRGGLPDRAGAAHDLAPVGHPVGDRRGDGGGHLSRLRALSVGDPAARQLDGLVSRCSICSPTASSASCNGNTCCPCSWARWSASSAARCPA